MYRTCSQEPMKGKHDGWAPIWNGSVHCLGPGFFTPHQACTQGNQQVRTEQNVWVHYNLHGDGLPFLVDVWNLHPCNETTRSVFPSNQVISPQRALGWESRAHKFWSSSQLWPTQTSWGCILSPPCMFFKDAPNLLKGSWRAGLGSVSLSVPSTCSGTSLADHDWMVMEWLPPLVHINQRPRGTESNNQLPKTEAFPSEKTAAAKLHQKVSYLLFLTPLSCPHHFIGVETTD